MSLIEDIRKDREAGTPGVWVRSGGGRADVRSGNPITGQCIANTLFVSLSCRDRESKVAECRANADRIARVPQMEAALLAAEELAASVGRSDSWFEIDAALDAYLAATGAS